MAVPTRPFLTMLEAAGRWRVAPGEVAGWAAAGRLQLLVAAPGIETAYGRQSGLLEIDGADLLASPVRLWRVRPIGGSDWLAITEPQRGLPVSLADVLVGAGELARFEDEHELVPTAQRAASLPSPSRYDWDAMYVAVIERIYEHGLPESQASFVGEFQEWFARRDPDGDAPDERTIRRRLTPIWRALKASE